MNAMALTGQVLMGQSVMVKSSEVGMQMLTKSLPFLCNGAHS